MKIAALTSVSGPYVVARYAAFSEEFCEHSLSLIEFGSTCKIYPWNHPERAIPYERVILTEGASQDKSRLELALSLREVLDSLNPDVLVVCGYGVRGMMAAIAWGVINRKRMILLSDSKEDDAPRTWWKEKLKAAIVRQFDAALVAGRPHQRYLRKLNFPMSDIFFGFDVVDNDTFSSKNISALPMPIEEKYFLAINRFVPKKNLLMLISAYKTYLDHESADAWHLVLCGDGKMMPQIKAKIDELGLREFVHLPGFLQQEALLPYFSHAKCFVHASIQEQWGLVVNEAMAAGLPVLVSNRCGCFEDLIADGITGFGFNPERADQLAELMSRVSDSSFQLESMGAAALKRIQLFSPTLFSQGLMQAIECAVSV